MFKLQECDKKILCVDCKEDCIFAGEISADCPKFHCRNNYHCDSCNFIKKYQEEIRKKYESCDKNQ